MRTFGRLRSLRLYRTLEELKSRWRRLSPKLSDYRLYRTLEELK